MDGGRWSADIGFTFPLSCMGMDLFSTFLCYKGKVFQYVLRHRNFPTDYDVWRKRVEWAHAWDRARYDFLAETETAAQAQIDRTEKARNGQVGQSRGFQVRADGTLQGRAP